MSRLVKSCLLGIAGALALGVLAFAIAPFFRFPMEAYLAPSALLVPIFVPLIPSSVVYWLMPEGGAPAGVLLIVVSTLFFWSALFGIASYFWLRHKAMRENAF